VAGDFNMIPGMRTHRTLKNANLLDSHGDAPTPTWTNTDPKQPIQFRLDYIFHDGHTRVVGTRVEPGEGSDHLLVSTDFAWAETETDSGAGANRQVATVAEPPTDSRKTPTSNEPTDTHDD
jgi:hypothetical protein